MIKITPEEFEQLRGFLQAETGIALAADKTYLVESRLAELVEDRGFCSFSEFLNFSRQKCVECAEFRNMLVDAMTTNETIWLRDDHPFAALRERLIPELGDTLEKKRRFKVRIWCAAASTGQEPYSIAMIVQEYLKKKPSLSPLSFDILGTDISSTALQVAVRGEYNEMAMNRGLPPEYKEKYFTRSDSGWLLQESLRKMVTFRKFNLMDSFAELPKFDIIFLRNVAIYFDEKFKRTLFQKMAKQLLPSGILFLGASESLWGLSDDFEKLTHANTVYYQVKEKQQAKK